MQEMRKARAALIILAILILLLLPFAFRYGSNPPAYIPAGNETSSEPLYILRAQGDCLVLINQNTLQLQTLDIDPRTLPPHDQEALAKGIPLESDHALEELLQDFGS